MRFKSDDWNCANRMVYIGFIAHIQAQRPTAAPSWVREVMDMKLRLAIFLAHGVALLAQLHEVSLVLYVIEGLLLLRDL